MIDPKGFNELKLCRSGPMLYNKNDVPIGLSLQKYGEFSWSEIELFRQIVEPGMLVVEAGANIGTHTIELSRMAAFVVAFEPQRISFQTLCANLALNNRTNVQALHAALGGKNGRILVPVRDQNVANNFGGVPLAGVTEGESVELMMLDRIEFSACGFIKIDIEGMEAEMLAGAQQTIATHRPILYMEADGAQAAEALKMLFDWKYECYWDLPRLFNPENFRGDQENAFIVSGSEISSINVVCLPAERPSTVSHLSRVESPDENGLERHNERIRNLQREAVLV